MNFGGPNGPTGPEEAQRIYDVEEETPDFESLLWAQNTYEEILGELDGYTTAAVEDEETREEIEMMKEDIRDTRAYLKVELQNLEPTDFLVGGNPEEYEEKAEKLFGPRIESLESRFEAAENYRERVWKRL